LIAALLASWAPSAAALDRAGALEVAKREMKGKCTTATSCKFDARIDSNRWYVRVEYPGGHAIYVINQGGKIVGRIERR
jgi:hypothetical protein